ncbi:MAG: tyrosine-type recombinase/integrase [Flavobacteriales bacterium]
MQLQPFYTYLLTEKRCSAHTLEAYRNDLEQFERFASTVFEASHHKDISQSMVRAWLASLIEHGYAVSSVHRKLSSVRALFRFLLKNNEAIQNPARGIPKPRKPIRLPVFVEESAMKHLYEPRAADGKFAELNTTLIIKLLYETGLRQSELLGLRDQDIDADMAQLKVTGKRNKVRLVPIGRPLLHDIVHYQQARMEHFEFFETSSLLITDKGKKITKSFLYKTVRTYLSQVTTVRRRSPHVLRHTFATHMLNNGADLNVIKEILGHSSLAATQVYTHNSIEKLKGVHSRLHPRNQ